MTDHRKRPRDPAQLAKFIVDVATGEIEDRIECRRRKNKGKTPLRLSGVGWAA